PFSLWLAITENNMATSTDKPGVAAPPPLLYGGAFIVVLLPRWFLPISNFGHAFALRLGFPMLVLRIWIAGRGLQKLPAPGTNVNPALPTTAIVASGPFRFSRNPLYLALTLLYLGLTLAFNTWWGIVLLVPVLITMHCGVVLREERYLEQKFGETYRQYRS